MKPVNARGDDFALPLRISVVIDAWKGAKSCYPPSTKARERIDYTGSAEKISGQKELVKVSPLTNLPLQGITSYALPRSFGGSSTKKEFVWRC